MKTQLAWGLIGSVFLMAGAAHAENGGRGGGDPLKNDAAAIELLLEGNGLKQAMLNYLGTLQVDQVRDDAVKATLTRVMKGGALQKDIASPGNYIISSDCVDGYSDSVPASALVGDVGGKICFNAQKLAQDYANLSEEDVMIRLASLAFHEHAHHFQDPSDPLKQNEIEAYRLSAYVQITAKVAEMPILKWVQQPSKSYYSRTEITGDGPIIRLFQYNKSHKAPKFDCPTDESMDCDGDTRECFGTEYDESRWMANHYGKFFFSGYGSCQRTKTLFSELKQGLIQQLVIEVDFSSHKVNSVNVQ